MVFLVLGALLFGAIGAMGGLESGHGATLGAVVGAAWGMFVGGVWAWQQLRARKYRERVDPPGPTLSRDGLALPGTQTPIRRRYRLAPVSTIAIAVFSAACLSVAVWGWFIPDAVIGWAFTGLAAVFAVLAWYGVSTYTSIGPHGVRVHTMLTARTVRWGELAEVGWLRDATGDFVVLKTANGTQIKTAGAFITATGGSRRRTLRMLSDIEHAWALAAIGVGQ
ncbi:MAG TPA: hypothetical protein VFC19_01835 [Candidatus Limnocylindrales bacterium]|nr:hypothetical protein [Candidatus Limnocylindrales bacterium]